MMEILKRKEVYSFILNSEHGNLLFKSVVFKNKNEVNQIFNSANQKRIMFLSEKSTFLPE